VLDGDSDLDPATNSRKVQPGRSGSGGHQVSIELGRVPATGGCLLIWINDTWVRSDLTSTPLATDIAWKWSRMITRVHRTPRQNNGCLAEGRSAERHLRCALNLQACSALGSLGHAANRRGGHSAEQSPGALSIHQEESGTGDGKPPFRSRAIQFGRSPCLSGSTLP